MKIEDQIGDSRGHHWVSCYVHYCAEIRSSYYLVDFVFVPTAFDTVAVHVQHLHRTPRSDSL